MNKKSVGNLTSCPSHVPRLWYAHLSRTSNHAEASRRYEYSDTMPQTRHNARYIHIHKASTGAPILTEIEIYQISERQERASSKRFSLCLVIADIRNNMPTHPHDPPALRGSLRGKYSEFLSHRQKKYDISA